METTTLAKEHLRCFSCRLESMCSEQVLANGGVNHKIQNDKLGSLTVVLSCSLPYCVLKLQQCQCTKSFTEHVTQTKGRWHEACHEVLRTCVARGMLATTLPLPFNTSTHFKGESGTPVTLGEPCCPAWEGGSPSWEQTSPPWVLAQACCPLPQEKSFPGLACRPSLPWELPVMKVNVCWSVDTDKYNSTAQNVHSLCSLLYSKSKLGS